jgi:hypothetical protein
MTPRRTPSLLAVTLAALALGPAATAAEPAAPAAPKRIVHAEVVALDQCFMLNRIGAVLPQGMVFALKRDVVHVDDPDGSKKLALEPGKVRLRDAKRARPIVLRANVGDELRITFTNLLHKQALPGQPATREAGVFVMGMNWIGGPGSDAAYAGANSNSIVPPGGKTTYRLYAAVEGTFLLTSSGADAPLISNTGVSNQLMYGLFGAVNVEPTGAVWYRSQVTQKDLAAASTYPPGQDLPRIDYEAKFPDGTPVLNMLRAAGEANGVPQFDIVYADLTAVIAGPHGGLFPDPPPDVACNPVYQNDQSRRRPYREITILYHDALTITPPFDPNAPGSATAMGAGGEAFAINYGSAAIGSEVLANRIGVGPMASAAEAKFEEFFLSSWVCGDPAMIVDVPANSPKNAPPPPKDPKEPSCPTYNPPAPDDVKTGPKATKAFYPDDPSNVYHSYLHDRTIFRVLHAGSGIPHVHHQHAHQWLRTPLSDKSLLLDSQTIIPGDGFSLEMIYGSGNRNLTAGDSIFHCHFYPHFAAGLWALWRVHDVFEAGTELDATGRPVPGSRALPDGEIPTGTPIPAVVPMPTLPMAPAPAGIKIVPATGPDGKVLAGAYKAELKDPAKDKGKNPGYPFFIPGIGGRRAPHPPLDFAIDETTKETLNGGLPRHIILDGTVPYEKHNTLDFTKENGPLTGVELPEDGTPLEQVAMKFHATPEHASFTPDGKPAKFATNGTGPRQGAPYANPGRTLDGKPIDGPVVRYKAADIQMDVVFNKKGWHYPQQRLIALWGDVKDTLGGARPPEPFFFRANSGSVIEFWQTNLVPSYYELDDFQVRTPTDVIGQHIHLVKFDVTSSDGAANGFNYEDGTFSPDEVRSRIKLLNETKGLWSFDMKQQTILKPKTIPFFGSGPGEAWVGAQTTVQRWYADPLLDCQDQDRTLGTVFTHDHFSPSTHQQIGLYAGLLIEPAGSKWLDNSTGAAMGERLAPPFNPNGKPTHDGGPTSWEAVIEPTDAKLADRSFREFALAFQDFSLAYSATSLGKAVPYTPYPTAQPPAGKTWGWVDPTNAIAPPAPPPTQPPPFPSLISSPPEPGTRTVNYRSEPVPFRIATGPAGVVDPNATDMSQVFRSIPRLDPQMNVQPVGPIAKGSPFNFPKAFAGAGDFDPFTPLMRSYANDRVRVRVLVGAHHNPHSFTFQGISWPVEPNYADSGFTSTQQMSISEHFEFHFRVPPATAVPAKQGGVPATDYLYQPSADTDGVANGVWGLLRAYDPRAKEKVPQLIPLPGNDWGKSPVSAPDALQKFYAGIPKAKVREFHVSAIGLGQAIAQNPAAAAAVRDTAPTSDRLMYALDSDLDPKTWTLKPDAPFEPLVLRAHPGDLIRVTLTNRFDRKSPVFSSPRPFQQAGLAFGSYDGRTSVNAGLHPQMLGFDMGRSAGANAGINPVQTVGPDSKPVTYEWYAGRLEYRADGTVEGTPIELGVINLLPSDPSFQHRLGLFAALVVEPTGSTWTTDPGTRIAATVTDPRTAGRFREFVLVDSDQTTTQGVTSVDYRSDPLGVRLRPLPKSGGLSAVDQTAANSNSLARNNPTPPVAYSWYADPATPICFAHVGDRVRFRVLHTYGNDYDTWVLHGHAWQTSPFAKNGAELAANPFSPWTGCAGQLPPTGHVDVLLDMAGGHFRDPGDYLYRNFSVGGFQGGQWGIFRVLPPGSDGLIVRTAEVQGQAQPAQQLVVAGSVTPLPSGHYAATVVVLADGKLVGKPVPIDQTTGAWSLKAPVAAMPARLEIKSAGGGTEVLVAPAVPVPLAAAAPPTVTQPFIQTRGQRFIRPKPPLTRP